MPRINDYQISIRVNQEQYMYLHTVENYTQYLNDLIDRDRLDRLDHKVIDSKIREHQEAIKELQGLKKTKHIDQDKIQELLNYHAPNYKENAPHRFEAQRLRFIEKSILPKLKKYGFKGSLSEIDELLLNWPEGDK